MEVHRKVKFKEVEEVVRLRLIHCFNKGKRVWTSRDDKLWA